MQRYTLTIPYNTHSGYDWDKPNGKERGNPFNYFTQGAACAEVEVDVLTGDWYVVRLLL
jgi:xanthine dehydrogenase/oxidase